MPESLSSYMVKLQHTGSLLQLFQTAASFGELSEALRKAVLWCKGHKLKPAAYFFRNKLLKSNRLHHVEAQGCRYVAHAGGVLDLALQLNVVFCCSAGKCSDLTPFLELQQDHYFRSLHAVM